MPERKILFPATLTAIQALGEGESVTEMDARIINVKVDCVRIRRKDVCGEEIVLITDEGPVGSDISQG